MKYLFLIVFTSMLGACSESEPRASFLHRVLDTLAIAHNGNVLIYTINPNDCLSCLQGFEEIKDQFEKTNIPAVYVFAVGRAVEKEAVIREMPAFDFGSTRNSAVVWDRELFDSINHQADLHVPLTTIFVYNYKYDTLLYSNPVKEVKSTAQIRKHLNWTAPGSDK